MILAFILGALILAIGIAIGVGTTRTTIKQVRGEVE